MYIIKINIISSKIFIIFLILYYLKIKKYKKKNIQLNAQLASYYYY